VQRVAKAGVAIIEGDVRLSEVLQRAGILTARLLVLAMPDEHATLAALQTARQINPTIQVLVRCHYASAGIQAQKMGADAVVVAEQVVAHELVRVLRASFLK
jgi:CPA2 family monovalent cation:H+ antiporter-2